jgi:hypothetical protein
LKGRRESDKGRQKRTGKEASEGNKRGETGRPANKMHKSRSQDFI